MTKQLKGRRILIVEDEPRQASIYARELSLAGAEVLTAPNVKRGFATFANATQRFDIVIIDMYLPFTDRDTDHPGAGFELADSILDHCVATRIRKRPLMIGMSSYRPDFSAHAIRLRFDGFVNKLTIGRELVSFILNCLENPSPDLHKPKIFIVHGHDDHTKLEVKNFLQNRLLLGEPVILHERPDHGRTIVEKFEEEAQDVDIVFVLLTPDDKVATRRAPDDIKRRARQNVIFEMGYFFGALQRRTGRVIVLKRGNVEIPTDIQGLIWVDISGGVEKAGETIRQELERWLPTTPKTSVHM